MVIKEALSRIFPDFCTHFCFPSLKALITAKNTKISEGFTKTFLNDTEMERVFYVIIGVFEDDRRPIPRTAPTVINDNVWWKMNFREFIFFLIISQFPDVFCLFIALRTSSLWIFKKSIQPQIEKPKISRRGWRCPKYAEFRHFTVLFGRERLWSVPRFKTHVQIILLINVKC